MPKNSALGMCLRKEFGLTGIHVPFCRCLEHIINLATQSLTKCLSTTDYSPLHGLDTLPDLDIHCDGKPQDLVAIIRAISVKVRSSAQRREVFLALQQREGLKGNELKMLKVDVATRWSSTYHMVIHAHELCEVGNLPNAGVLSYHLTPYF